MIKKIDLLLRHKKQIFAILKNHLTDVEVWAYGSRVNGKSHPASDLDLVLRAPDLNEIPSSKLSELKTAFADSNIPFLVEVRDWALLPDSFHNEIKSNYIVFFKGNKQGIKNTKGCSSSNQKKSILERKKSSHKGTSKTENLFEFKQTEIGTVPKNWEVCTIEKLFDLKQGKSLSSKNQTGLYLKPFLRTSNVFWGYLSLTKVDEMDIPEKERKALSLKKEDLLVCEGGDIGRTAIWNEELEECYYQNHIHRLRAKEKNVSPLFYMYWMDVAIRILNIYGTFGNRTTIPNLPGKRLLKFKIPHPPLPEQEKIAGILSQIQRAIEVQNELIETAKELKRSTMKQLFTCGIKGQKTKQTEIGEIPEEWDVCSISEIGDVITGTTPKTSNETYYGGQYKLISPADLDSGKYVNTAHRMLSEEGLSQCRTLPRYSVLVGCIGNIGKVGMTLDKKSATNQQINAIVCNQKSNPHFVFYCLFFFKKNLQLKASQTTVPILNKTNFEHFKIPCPPLPEQKEISDILTKIDQKIQTHKKKKSKLEELFKTMLNKLMTGKIRAHKLNIKSITGQ